MKKIIIFTTLIVLLSACSQASIQEPKFEDLKNHVHIVKSATDEGLFVNHTSYQYKENVKLRTKQGDKIEPSDIQAGSLIEYKDTGMVMESYPSQGTIKSVTLYDDQLSRKIEKGIAHFLTEDANNETIGYKLVALENDLLTIEFTDYFDTEKVYSATINLESLEFEVTPL
ncbi:membrane lipoprotein lipid attachment site-containing protein [Paenisporosarcina quisquiliarum]|uniref:Membrane lipoprotein lipid attachment site-containing protein n=1 Tax=Paenisporosarcina quisquiliarum TaxID=365346 RepID=A0A9X3LHI3_9BACL|nr:membrane lipoprotein lipid attachment site-containing protein [Paenisporosarcina quisquiliarum]MCZ8538100.1 membrane lipoprotein lipid attachment site-containing protein [Paenisporosarcina quisquiliarum]